jgi:hypothetical protein
MALSNHKGNLGTSLDFERAFWIFQARSRVYWMQRLTCTGRTRGREAKENRGQMAEPVSTWASIPDNLRKDSS